MFGYLDSNHSVQLSVTIIPKLERHLFRGELASLKEANMIIAKNSYLDMGAFIIPLRIVNHCSTLDHLNPTTDVTSRISKTAFLTIPGNNFKPETVLADQASTATKVTSMSSSVISKIWHKRLGTSQWASNV